MILRKHQVEIKQHFADIRSNKLEKQVVIAHVEPGAGKSWLPAIALGELPSNYRLGIFTPRLLLRDQMALGTKKDFGIELHDCTSIIDPSRGKRGFVSTHQSLVENTQLWVDEFKRNRYLLVPDEIHHAGFNTALYKSLCRILPYASQTLLMTGVLERSDGQEIFNVKYKQKGCVISVDWESTCDKRVRYDRKDALEEKAIVPIAFYHHDGPVEFKRGDELVKLESISDAEKRLEGAVIFTALRTRLADQLLEQCIDHWQNENGKLLVVVARQSIAKEVHKKLKKVFPCFLAIQDNENAAADVRKFHATKQSILVTCQMAYEGLDDKELTHMALLTHIRSRPWIIQALARVWRANPDQNPKKKIKEKKRCYCFCPDDPAMNRVIDQIREYYIGQMMDTDGPGDGPPEIMEVRALDGGVDEITVSMLDGDHLSVDQEAFSDALVARGLDPNDGRFSEAMKALSDTGEFSGNGDMTSSERCMDIRRNIAKTCRKNDNLRNHDPGDTQKTLIRITKKSIKDMTESELNRAHEKAKAIYAR